APLLRHQLATFRQQLRMKRDALMFMIEDSGHIIPADQPEVYARVIQMLLTGGAPREGIVIVKSANETRILNRIDSEKMLNEWERKLRSARSGSGLGTL